MKKLTITLFILNLFFINLNNLSANDFSKKYFGIGLGKSAMSSNAEADTVANVNLRRETILTDSYNGGDELKFFYGELFSLSNNFVHGYEFVFSDVDNSNDADYYSTNSVSNTDFTEARLDKVFDVNYRLGKINENQLDYFLLGLSYANVNYRLSHQNGNVISDDELHFPGINLGLGREHKFKKFIIDYRINYAGYFLTQSFGLDELHSDTGYGDYYKLDDNISASINLKRLFGETNSRSAKNYKVNANKENNLNNFTGWFVGLNHIASSNAYTGHLDSATGDSSGAFGHLYDSRDTSFDPQLSFGKVFSTNGFFDYNGFEINYSKGYQGEPKISSSSTGTSETSLDNSFNLNYIFGHNLNSSAIFYNLGVNATDVVVNYNNGTSSETQRFDAFGINLGMDYEIPFENFTFTSGAGLTKFIIDNSQELDGSGIYDVTDTMAVDDLLYLKIGIKKYF